VEALALLRGEAPHKDRVKPELIFLDMNLPKYSGLDLVEKIRKTKGLEHTPIVVLSGSMNPENVRDVYKLGANCFVRKPMEFVEFIHCITACCEFWCNVAVLPPV
jgi:CheY-like chemotaxis protein